jgi:hypothetical protein
MDVRGIGFEDSDPVPVKSISLGCGRGLNVLAF